MFYRTYVFGTAAETDAFYSPGRAEAPDGKELKNIVHVSAQDLYQPEKGYGFVTEENRREQELLKLPELNSGFDTVYWYQDEILSRIEEDEYGCYLDSDGIMAELKRRESLNPDEKVVDTIKKSDDEGSDKKITERENWAEDSEHIGSSRENLAGEGSAEETRPLEEEHRRIPLSFKLDVPHQGNYQVTVKIRRPRLYKDPCTDSVLSDTSDTNLMIFTGRRRLGYLVKYSGSAKEILRPDGSVDSGEVFYAKSSGAQNGISGADSINISSTETSNDLSDESSREHAKESSKEPWTEQTYTMTVNVCDIIPRGQTIAYSDTTLDITILAGQPRISELTIEEVDCATIYIAGDSTVTDQSADYPYAPGTSYSGWGQMLSAYLTGDVAVSNHAHSGLTTESFREEGHYAIVEKYIRKGDYCLFQFAHNDQKLDHLKAQGGYRQNLERYIRECREKGAYPILVTPLARNTWKGGDGSYNDLLAEYAEVCKEIGSELQVPVADLHGRSMEWIMQNGREAVRTSFFPDDYTHTNDYGAYRMAGFVADELVRVCRNWTDGQPQAHAREDGSHDRPQAHICSDSSGYQFLAACVTGGFGEWNPPACITLPVKPAAYEHVSNPEGDAQLLAEISDPEHPASRVDVLDMVIKTVRFFYTNVYNDMFADVIGHEWYAGAVECAYQNGIIDEHLVENGYFYPEKEVTVEEFLVFAINGYKSRRELPPQTPCAYDETCAPWARPYVRAACELGLLERDGSDDLHQAVTRGEAAKLCRKMKV
ncbi:MAG: GDSL-type esterase/lipase family protein [Lachnospiraceae bacterium]|nr:GDSL-type esterase/lipase family protein [Lachnospiraceae bacterium]